MWTKKIQLLLLLLLLDCHAESPYYVPNFTPNVNYRTNFCSQHAAVESGEIPLRNALEGVAIAVGFSSYQLNATTGAIDEENPNIIFEFMDELAERANFRYRNNYGRVDGPGANETWTDVLYYTTDVYDMSGDWWAEVTSRLEQHIIYPDGWYDGNFVMVGNSGKSAAGEFNFSSFAAPFTPGLWGLIALTTVVSGILYYILDYFDSRIKGRAMDMGLEASLFFTAFLMEGNYVHQPKSRSTRIFVFSMAFFFFVVVACYTANLASFLVMKNQQIVINDIQDVIRNDLKICVEKDTAFVDFLKSFRIQPRHLVLTSSEGDEIMEGPAFRSLLEGKCDIVFTSKSSFDAFKRKQQYNPDCKLELVGRIQKILSAGFALRDSEQYCTSILRDVLHLHMLEMKESGKYDEIWDNYLNKGTTNSCNADNASGDDDENQVDLGLGVANLSGVFALHAMALVLSLMITLFNFCQLPEHRKKTMIHELESGMHGSTTLNRAVAFAAENSSGFFSSGKNDQTGANRCARKAASNQSLPPIQESTEKECTNIDSRPDRVTKNLDLDEVKECDKTQFDLLMEQNKEKKRLIELLLQKLQKLDERDQQLNERDQTMDERIKKIEEKI